MNAFPALGDRYRIERELGRGGMATVYLVHDPKHDRSVAVKVLHPTLAVTLGVERFLREIQIAARLQHPHILGVIDSGTTTGPAPQPYYGMPFVEGETLRQRIGRERQLSVDEALRLTREIGEALHYAHEQGLVHRDVKPENVLLSRGHALVADFGIARAVRAAGGERLTETGISLGTPAYMSPEQASGDREVDARSDLYSLGCVLYELLAGQPPFTGPSSAAVLARQVLDPVPPLATLRAGLATGLVAALSRALAKTPADRFESVAAFLEALTTPTAGPGEVVKSIVVLPFTNLSPDPDNEYFADGLTEELIADLSKVRALRVISRTSAMHFKGTTKDLRAIAGELKVRYVLEGSVRRAGNSLRITAQLIEAESDAHLWAEKYAGTVDDVFDMQEKLSKQIVSALEIVLSPAEAAKVGERKIGDARAYQCYLRALNDAFRGTPESLASALRQLEAALQLIGPNEVLFGAMGLVHWYYVNWGLGPIPEHLVGLEEFAAKARSLNPASEQAEVLAGLLHFRRGMMQQAAKHFQRALDIDPQQMEAMIFLAFVFLISGHGERAVPLVQQAVERDPLSFLTQWLVWTLDLFRNRFVAALPTVRALAEATSENPGVLCGYATNLARVGRTTEAVEVARRAGRDFAASPIGALGTFFAHAWSGEAESAHAAFSDGVRDFALHDESTALFVAEGYVLIHDTSSAMYWLEHVTLDRGFINYPFLMKDEFLVPLRDEPRFISLMAEVKRRWEAFEV